LTDKSLSVFAPRSRAGFVKASKRPGLHIARLRAKPWFWRLSEIRNRAVKIFAALFALEILTFAHFATCLRTNHGVNSVKHLVP
jgi:hypothetical protein